MVRITTLNNLVQDGVSNNAGQLVVETVPVQAADDAHRNNAEQLVAPEHSQAHPVSEYKNMRVYVYVCAKAKQKQTRQQKVQDCSSQCESVHVDIDVDVDVDEDS